MWCPWWIKRCCVSGCSSGRGSEGGSAPSDVVENSVGIGRGGRCGAHSGMSGVVSGCGSRPGSEHGSAPASGFGRGRGSGCAVWPPSCRVDGGGWRAAWACSCHVYGGGGGGDSCCCLNKGLDVVFFWLC